MKKYKFSIPIKLKYIIDESLLSIDSVDDLREIEEQHNIDLSEIIDKCESDLGEEINDYDDEDYYYYVMSKEDSFQYIITDNWNSIMKKLNKEHKLKDLEEEKVKILFDYTSKNFNKEKLNGSLDLIIEDIELSSYNIPKSEFYVNVTTSRELSNDEIENLRSWLDLQTTEEWGDKFSKIDISDILDIDEMSVYLIPWSLKKDVKYIK